MTRFDEQGSGKGSTNAAVPDAGPQWGSPTSDAPQQIAVHSLAPEPLWRNGNNTLQLMAL